MPAAQVEALSVYWTNMSIFPPLYGLLLRRVGVVLVAGESLGMGEPLGVVWSFGLSVSSGPVGPLEVILVYRPLTVGVPGLAWNVVPSVLAAYG